jgi:putative folate metabolism gamma-glutamate ligase
MFIKPYKTPIVQVGDKLFNILEAGLPKMLEEESIVVVTSKIVALCEEAVVKIQEDWTKEDKQKIVEQESEYFIDPHSSKYHFMLTIRNQIIAVNAGIDESNADGYFVLWPKNLQESANQIWRWLREKYQLQKVGVILSDSRTFPLKWGVIGTSLAHCGFLALKDMRGRPDLFGRPMKMTQINVAEALAVAAVYEMGETNESTPLAVIHDARDVTFQEREPSEQELHGLTIEMQDDVYAPILQKAQWKKGGHR